MKKQILVVHGGDTFAEKDYQKYLEFLKEIELDYSKVISDKSGWKRGLRKFLGEEYDVILPSMPNKFNARYEEWKLWFEKFFVFLHDEVILIGHSMGGAFLCKYLTENRFPKKIKALFLVAAVYNKDTDGNPLHTFKLPEKLNVTTENIYIYHSKDDSVVPLSDAELYHKQFPSSLIKIFEARGHFNQEEFPEIIEDIKNLA
jgi:predicted alpha/beta hydrolase family esterase